MIEQQKLPELFALNGAEGAKGVCRSAGELTCHGMFLQRQGLVVAVGDLVETTRDVAERMAQEFGVDPEMVQTLRVERPVVGGFLGCSSVRQAMAAAGLVLKGNSFEEAVPGLDETAYAEFSGVCNDETRARLRAEFPRAQVEPHESVVSLGLKSLLAQLGCLAANQQVVASPAMAQDPASLTR